MTDSEGKKSGVVLVADDEPAFRTAFCQMLSMRGYRTVEAGTPNEVLDVIRSHECDLVTLDLDWDSRDVNGLDLLREIRRIAPLVSVVIITGHASIPTAVEGTRLGAFDYIEKMHDREKTMLTIKNAIESSRLKRENDAFLSEIRRKYEIIGSSTAIDELYTKIRKVGPTTGVVLITGASGTGKELVARQIHLHSERRDRKFVSVDSGTLADSLAESELFGHRKGAFTGAIATRKGLIEEAEGGTLFLDEISSASLSLQASLLRVIQEHEFRPIGENEYRKCEVRIIAASNRNLPELIDNKEFREDLYYRLKVVEIFLPPLRDRKEDIPALARHFLEEKSRKYGMQHKKLTNDAINILFDYDWPGNIRELENTIERIVILSDSDEITADGIKSILENLWIDHDRGLKPLSEMTDDFRRECILKALNLADGRVAKAAEILQIDRTHLYKLIDNYNLKNPPKEH